MWSKIKALFADKEHKEHCESSFQDIDDSFINVDQRLVSLEISVRELEKRVRSLEMVNSSKSKTYKPKAKKPTKPNSQNEQK
jgi:hypothetical protein